MNNFEQDLSAWETGEMTVSELESAHPELDVTGLVSLHESLTTMTAVPAPDPEMSWQRLEAQLPARSRLSDRAKSWVRRPLMIVIATTALSTGAAYAAGLEPQRSVQWVWERVTGHAATDHGTEKDPTAGTDNQQEPGSGNGAVDASEGDNDDTDATSEDRVQGDAGEQKDSGDDSSEPDANSGSSDRSGTSDDGDDAVIGDDDGTDDHSNSGSGSANSGPGGGEDRDGDDHSGPGGGDDVPDDDSNSGPGSGSDDAPDGDSSGPGSGGSGSGSDDTSLDEDHSGSGPGTDDVLDPVDDHSGKDGGDSDTPDDDSSGSGSGGSDGSGSGGTGSGGSGGSDDAAPLSLNA